MIGDRVAFEDLGPDDLCWVNPQPGVELDKLAGMLERIANGVLTCWRLKPPSRGICVTYPSEGRLFIYYLQGTRILDTLSTKDLLDHARACGLRGMAAETHKRGVLKLLKAKGFRHIRTGQTGIHVLELDDVR